MYRFFAPVVLPEGFNFFGAAKEGALDKRLINSSDQLASLAGIAG
jgi:hypothetical protein